MAGSMSDALKESGLAPKDPTTSEPTPSKKEWLHELPAEEERPPHVPFEAPALIRLKNAPKKK